MVVIRVWCLSYHINLWQQANDNRVLVLPPDLFSLQESQMFEFDVAGVYVQLFILLYIQELRESGEKWTFLENYCKTLLTLPRETIF